MNCQIFARRLKDSMNDKGIKQIDLINQLNLNSGAVSCYITGKYMPRNETMLHPLKQKCYTTGTSYLKPL